MNRQLRLALTGLLAFLMLAATGAVFAQDARDPGERNVSYPGPNGITLSGYLATPRNSGPAPAVVMIHEWWGLNHDTTVLADALAREGFVVLAADAFRGSVAQSPADARKQVTETPRERIAADLEIGVPRFTTRKHYYPVEDENLEMLRDMSKCLQCRRCVVACKTPSGEPLFGMAYRGFDSKVVHGHDQPLGSSSGKDYDACIDICPSGALQKARKKGEERADRALIIKG